MINWNETPPNEKRELMRELVQFQTCNVAEYLGTSERNVRKYRQRLGIVGGREKLIHTPEFTKMVRKSESKAKENCCHHFHMQKCSTCGKVMSSESKVNVPIEIPELFLIDGVEFKRQDVKKMIYENSLLPTLQGYKCAIG